MIRVVAWRVQPIVVDDDGTYLTPITVQPADIPAAQWQAFKNGGDDIAIGSIAAAACQIAPPTLKETNP